MQDCPIFCPILIGAKQEHESNFVHNEDIQLGMDISELLFMVSDDGDN